ncbi:phage head completion protein [Salipiger abyssi]|uniref:phage head completion protein n=1 Tax=Salipiger abyssi TaxID=1250539 RepID=UPI004058FCD6
MSGAGALCEWVAFDFPIRSPDGTGGTETGWSTSPDSIERRASFIYARGSEVVDAARLNGRAIYKIKLRSDRRTREISPSWRMRDLRRGTEYNLREVDAITDRQWVYVVVESGVAV